jgi:uncharacterized protein YcnI
MRSAAIALFCLCISSAWAHITMEPNSGFAAGSYFASAIKVPHGHNGMYTSSLKLYVPKGIMSAVPEIPTGWNCTITNRQLPVNERYMSHGSLVTTAPDTILWEAETPDDTVSNSHLLMILVQFKLGCVFNDSSSASMWQGSHTLWFRIEQHSSSLGGLHEESTHYWTGTQRDRADGTSPPWSATTAPEQPCPYVFFYPSTSCAVPAGQIAPQSSAGGGITSWFGRYFPPVEEPDLIRDVQHARSVANEELLEALEDNTVLNLADLDGLKNDYARAIAIASIALVLSALVSVIFLALGCLRIFDKRCFAMLVFTEPITSSMSAIKTSRDHDKHDNL